MNKFKCYYKTKDDGKRMSILNIYINEDQVNILSEDADDIFKILSSDDDIEKQTLVDILMQIAEFITNLDQKYKDEVYSETLINDICDYINSFITKLCTDYTCLSCEHIFE